MKYIIPSQYYLYNILVGGDSFESLIEQQIFLAANGIDWNTSSNFIDIEREIAVNLLIKKKKEEMEQKMVEWNIFCRLFSN